VTDEDLIKELEPTDKEVLIYLFKNRLKVTDKDLKGYNQENNSNTISFDTNDGIVDGYPGFHIDFKFSDEGKLIGADIGEY